MTKPNPHRRQCAARSKRTGKRCGRHVAPGYDRCRHHAGVTPARAKATAAERIGALIDPSIAALAKALRSHDPRISAPTAVRVLALAREHGLLDVNARRPDEETRRQAEQERRALALLSTPELRELRDAVATCERFDVLIAQRLAAVALPPALPVIDVVPMEQTAE